MMKTLAFHSYRGGVGKTLLSVNTAVKLALSGKKVCLIDFDLRAPSHQSYFKISENTVFLTDYLLDKALISEILNQTSINENLMCIFSDIEILQKNNSERVKITQHGEGKVLAKLFSIIRYCEAKGFDYIIIDVMPGITYRSLDAIIVSDDVMLITRPVKSEIKGLELLISECYSKTEASFYAIINQIEDKEDLAKNPSEIDANIAKENYDNLKLVFEKSIIKLPFIHSFKRIPFLTERIYVKKELNHPFSEEITKLCEKIK